MPSERHETMRVLMCGYHVRWFYADPKIVSSR
jgi:hypothetical protein